MCVVQGDHRVILLKNIGLFGPVAMVKAFFYFLTQRADSVTIFPREKLEKDNGLRFCNFGKNGVNSPSAIFL